MASEHRIESGSFGPGTQLKSGRRYIIDEHTPTVVSADGSRLLCTFIRVRIGLNASLLGPRIELSQFHHALPRTLFRDLLASFLEFYRLGCPLYYSSHLLHRRMQVPNEKRHTAFGLDEIRFAHWNSQSVVVSSLQSQRLYQGSHVQYRHYGQFHLCYVRRDYGKYDAFRWDYAGEDSCKFFNLIFT